jgi:hypothetical protein
VHRLVGRDRKEIGYEPAPHLRRRSARHVEREVDGDELDVRQRMPQGDAVPV